MFQRACPAQRRKGTWSNPSGRSLSKEIEEARDRIAGTVLRTPLVRLDLGPGGPDIRLKLENLQPTNAYKIRGAANAVGQARRRGAGARASGR